LQRLVPMNRGSKIIVSLVIALFALGAGDAQPKTFKNAWAACGSRWREMPRSQPRLTLKSSSSDDSR